MSYINLHEWQKDALKVIKRCNRTDEHNVIPVNACVSSGKTTVASLAFADFIDLHKDEKTMQMFVTPRIKLCKQQNANIIDNIKNIQEYSYQTFDVFDKDYSTGDYAIVQVDCEHDAWSRDPNKKFEAKHIIFVICDASLWGNDDGSENTRWTRWLSRFKKFSEEQGYVFGNAIFDEAHNFTTNAEKIFSTSEFKKNSQIGYKGKGCVLNYFHNVMMLSGTPDSVQKRLTEVFPQNVCECPLNVALAPDHMWACRPVLNIVRILNANSSVINYSNAVIQVLEREKKIVKDPFSVRLLVNFGSIDEIKAFQKDEYIQENMGKLFHLVTIHSGKLFEDAERNKEEFHPTVDGSVKEYSSIDIYDALELLDDGTADSQNAKATEIYDKIVDGLPIVVCQVKMIGEGINIKSFNSVITKSTNDTTAMQQIGRVLRNYEKNGHKKAEPNVYCIETNVNDLQSLLINLEIEHSLTADCFSWGDKIEISTGSAEEDDDDNEKKLCKFKDPHWTKIDPDIDKEICQIHYSTEFFNRNLEKLSDKISSTEKFDSLIKSIISKYGDKLYKMRNAVMKTFKFTDSNGSRDTSMKKTIKRIDKKYKKSNDLIAPSADKDVKEESTNESANEGVVPESSMPECSNVNASSDAVEYSNEELNDAAESSSSNGMPDGDAASMVFCMIVQIQSFVKKHAYDAKIQEIAKKDISMIVKYLYSYIPDMYSIIEESGILNDSALNEIIQLSLTTR